MNLRRIVLEAITPEEFSRRRQESFGLTTRTFPHVVYAAITGEVSFRSYKRLIKDFLYHEWADQVQIQDGDRTVLQAYVRHMRKDFRNCDAATAWVSEAASDPGEDISKAKHVSLFYKSPSPTSTDRIRLAFGELNGQITLRAADVDAGLGFLVSMPTFNSKISYIRGVYVPKPVIVQQPAESITQAA